MLLTLLMISWGLVTAVLAVIVVYGGTLSVKEDDQIFLDPAEQHHYREQQVIIAKVSRLKAPIITLSVISGASLLASAGIWVYRGLMSF